MALASRPRPQHHHKKARGEHHRQSKHYLKTYHPYLPLLLLVVIGLAVNVVWAGRTSVLGASTNMTATSLLHSTNRERSKHNTDTVSLNNKLTAAAQTKANDMVKRKYWSHQTPNGDTPWHFIKKSGYQYYTAGENLAYGFGAPDQVIAGWLNSPEHRANMLERNFTEVGFGIATAENFQNQARTTIVVAMYAEPSLAGGAATLGAFSGQPTNPPMRSVARVQLLTGGAAPWSLALLTLISVGSVVWYLTRHVKAWKRVVIESEEFIVHHKFLDVLIITAAVAGFVLTRAAGFIH